MNKDGSGIENAEFPEPRDFRERGCVRALSGVNDKGPARRRASQAIADIRSECERVRPSKPAHDAYGKATRENRRLAGIVMRNGRDAAQEIPDSSPRHAVRLRDEEMLANRRPFRMMDGRSPGRGVRIRSLAKAREETELEVVVGIDQSGQDEMTCEIEL
jgi:hypothetical protein